MRYLYLHDRSWYDAMCSDVIRSDASVAKWITLYVIIWKSRDANTNVLSYVRTSKASTTVTPKEGSLGIPFDEVLVLVGSTAGVMGPNFSAPLLHVDKNKIKIEIKI